MQYRCAVLSLLLLVAGHAGAAAPADPAEPKAEVSPLTYKSVFEGYRRHDHAPVGSWKEANDNVGRIGGWRVYLKEAQQPDAPGTAPASQPKPATVPKPAPSAGHRHH